MIVCGSSIVSCAGLHAAWSFCVLGGVLDEPFGNTPLFELLQTGELSVNSRHHQAIKDLAPDLVAMAQATDGLIEAVYHPDYLFVWAVQWHPEHMYRTDLSKQLARKFIQACRDRKKL